MTSLNRALVAIALAAVVAGGAAGAGRSPPRAHAEQGPGAALGAAHGVVVRRHRPVRVVAPAGQPLRRAVRRRRLRMPARLADSVQRLGRVHDRRARRQPGSSSPCPRAAGVPDGRLALAAGARAARRPSTRSRHHPAGDCCVQRPSATAGRLPTAPQCPRQVTRHARRPSACGRRRRCRRRDVATLAGVDLIRRWRAAPTAQRRARRLCCGPGVAIGPAPEPTLGPTPPASAHDTEVATTALIVVRSRAVGFLVGLRAAASARAR